MRAFVAIGGGLVFAGSLLYFAWQYAVGFDVSDPPEHIPAPVVLDVLLFTVFALHHSVFARLNVKAAIGRVTSPELERSIYVWIASLLFVAVCALWLPVSGVLWEATGPVAWLLRGVQLFAAVFTVAAARHLDVLDLAGIRQAIGLPSNRPTKLDHTGPYGLVRHPIYLGWLLLVWPAPFMNGTRLVFAAISTLYLFAAIPFEERDLRRTFGDAYARYAERVKHKMIPGVF